MGALVILPDGEPPLVFDGSIPQQIINKWTSSGSKQVIAQAELLTVVAMRYNLRHMLHRRKVIFFIDNEAARFALIKSVSGRSSMQALASAFHRCDLSYECFHWIERVASQSNPADLPTRNDTDVLLRMTGGKYAGKITIDESLLSDVLETSEEAVYFNETSEQAEFFKWGSCANMRRGGGAISCISPGQKSSCGFELKGRWERRRSPSQRDGPFFRSPVNLWTNPSKSGICNSFVFELDSPIHSSGMNSAAWYVNSSKRLALRHFTHWHLLYFYFELELACMSSAAWYVNSSKRLALRHFTHWHLLYFFSFWFGIGWSHAALAWTLGTWTLPRGLLSDTSHTGICFIFFYFDLELDGHMQLLHELSVRELFQEACSQTLHSHACCLNYSMEVDLCIEAVSEIYLLALPLFRSRVGVVGAHDFICKASPATLRPPCDILHQPRTKKQLRIWVGREVREKKNISS